MSVTIEHDVPSTMRDGVVLRSDVYLPAAATRDMAERLPTVLVRTTYDKRDPSGSIDPELFAEHGYAVVIQDVRGRFASEGTFYHGIAEVDDGYDTLEWIAAQPWSNGRVGMTGISYLAAVQCAAACSGSPHLASIFHVKAPLDYYRNGNRHGGNFNMYMVPITFFFASTGPEAAADPVLQASLLEAFHDGPDWLQRMPIKKGLNPLAATPGIEAWLYDMMTKADYDEFWKSVPLWQPGEYIAQYVDVPGCYVGGWYDMYREETFYEMLVPRKAGPIELIMGPWTHRSFASFSGDVDFGLEAEWSPAEYYAVQLRWFDRTLKGKSVAVEELPVKIFVMGGGSGRRNADGRMDHGGRWREEHQWPLTRTQWQSTYFHPGNRLSTDLPPADGGSMTYVYDPANPVPTIGGVNYFLRGRREEVPKPADLELYVPYGAQDQRERRGVLGCSTDLPLSSRHDVLVFQTEPLTTDIEVTGRPVVKLWFASSAVDTDFTAKLIDVCPPNPDYPDGYAMNLSDGILRVRYRQSFEEASFLVPDEIYECSFELYAVSNLFKAGHRIRVDISSSDYPAYDPNPNTGGPIMHPGQVPIIARNTIFHDAQHPSHVLLPLVPANSST